MLQLLEKKKNWKRGEIVCDRVAYQCENDHEYFVWDERTHTLISIKK